VLASDRRRIVTALRRNLDAAAQEIAGGDAHAGGQAVRVARRFALAATAGDLATRYGLTGWPEGEALVAARACYTAWLDGFGGTGNREERQLFAHVCGFLEAHGGSRFEPHTLAVDPESQDKDHGPVRPIPSRGLIRDRVGFTKPDGQGAPCTWLCRRRSGARWQPATMCDGPPTRWRGTAGCLPRTGDLPARSVSRRWARAPTACTC
jgi:hypothetical protein